MDNFKLATNVYFGQDSLSALDEIQNKSVIIICDAFMVQSGMVDKVKAHLQGCEIFVFDKVVPDPPTEIVAEGINCLIECRAEYMIALGGGSAIDAAKAIRVLADKAGRAHIDKCFAIPTTSGTGSEVTRFSVITNVSEGVKYPLVEDDLQPMVAILDPDLVKSVPPQITADTGMDALTHALEAYVSTKSNDFTDALAEKAITLLVKFLPFAYAHGEDMEAREKVHNAACLAGMAFNMVGLGICHSVAHQIGAKFHVPHGRANAMVLPHVIEYNADVAGADTVCSRKYRRIAKLIGLSYSSDSLAASSLVTKIQDMNRLFGIPENLKAIGISEQQVNDVRPDMISAALGDVCTETNPRGVGYGDIDDIISKVLG